MKEYKRMVEKKMFYWRVLSMIGFTLCIVVAAFSFWAAVFSSYSYKMVFIAIAVLAFIQAIIRLFQIKPSSPE